MFAQLMGEMLTPTTFESFRVYSLDTHARLLEALQLTDDVKRLALPRATFEPVAEELEWSLSKDAAARALAGSEVKSLLNLLINKKGFEVASFTSHLRLISRLLKTTYKTKLEEIILDIFSDPTKYNEKRKLTGFYCSHLINLGYSRRYLLEIVHDYFFSKDISRIGARSLARFFGEFDGRQKKFIVHAAISDDLGTYLRRHGSTVRSVRNLTNEQRTTLVGNVGFTADSPALEMTVDQLDPYAAMDVCYQLLSAQRAITYLDPSGMVAEWGSTMHVTRLRAQSGVAITKGDFLVQRGARRRTSPLRPRSIANYAKSILGSFDENSTERILSSIRTAALARSSRSPENQLISLWSAIEVLLSEPRDEARIIHYASLIAPCITLRHTRRQLIALYDELLIGYGVQFRRIVRRVPRYGDIPAHRAFAELTLLPEHEALRDNVNDLLEANPLALHRVAKFAGDYHDTVATATTLADHSNRVRWQIHRVYRARNQLVHAGRLPTYLESVILNLAEYYRSAIATIVNRAKREGDRSDIDQVVAEIGIACGIFYGAFEKQSRSPMTIQRIALLMDETDVAS